MVYEPKEWGTYTWDPELSIAENVTAARTAKALIEVEDLQRIEDALAEGVSGQNGINSLWAGTQSEYDNIVVKDPSTVYIVKE